MKNAAARILPVLIVALAGFLVTATTLSAQGPGRLVAIVNDEAVSEYDLSQRVKLNETLNGARGSVQQRRRAALTELIENILKRQEAKRLSLTVTADDVEDSYNSMASRAGVSKEAWATRLKKGGVSVKTVKREIEASLSWRRVVRARFGRRIQVENADIDREYQRALEVPRDTEHFYVVRRIILPLQRNASEIQISIAVANARTIMSRFRGCGRINQATQNIFKATVQPPQTIPRSQAPSDLRQALDGVGPGKAIGPGRGPEGVFVVAYCERKTVEAPQITREAVEQQLLYRKFDRIGAQFLSDLKRDAIIEYKMDDLRS